MSKYLRQAKTGRIYPWTKALAERPDMEECAAPETGGAPVYTASTKGIGIDLLNNLATTGVESLGEGQTEADKEPEKTATPSVKEEGTEETGKTALKELKDYTEAELRELKHTELKTLLAGKFTGSPTKDALIALALEG